MENGTTKPSEMNYDVKPNTEGEGNTPAETAVSHSNLPKITKKNVLLSLGLFIVVVVISTTFLLLTFRSPVDKDQPVATFGEKTLYQSDITKEYNTRYSTTPVASFQEIEGEARTQLVDSIIERLILEKEALKLGVIVAEQDILNEIKQRILAGIPESILNQKSVKEEIRISLLKNRLKEKLITFRQISVATIFVPEGPGMPTRFINAQTLLSEFRSDVLKGMTFTQANEIAKQKSYYNKGLVIDEKYLTKKDSEMTFLGPTAFSLKKGGVSEVIDSGGGTLGVIYVKEAGDYEFNSLDEWLAAEKKRISN